MIKKNETDLTPEDLKNNRELTKLYNREKVRDFLEKNLGAKRKEVTHATGLSPNTVSRAIAAIRQEHRLPSPLTAFKKSSDDV